MPLPYGAAGNDGQVLSKERSPHNLLQVVSDRV
jgi:hypothetical protein